MALAIVRDTLLAVGGLLQSRRLGRFTSSLWSGKVAVTALAVTVVAALLVGVLSPLRTPAVLLYAPSAIALWVLTVGGIS